MEVKYLEECQEQSRSLIEFSYYYLLLLEFFFFLASLSRTHNLTLHSLRLSHMTLLWKEVSSDIFPLMSASFVLPL